MSGNNWKFGEVLEVVKKNNRPTQAVKTESVIKKTSVKSEMAVTEGGFFSKYKISRELVESGEYFAEVKEFNETKDYVRLSPYEYVSGNKIYYEDVFLNLGSTNSPSSPAGQFLILFSGARHFNDIKDRCIGVEIKLNEGKEQKVFKNVVRVFQSTEDDLVFDDEHMKHNSEALKDRIIKKVLVDPDDEDDEDDYLDEDDEDDDYIDDDEEE